MSNQKGCDSQDQNNIQSPKLKEKDKTWTKEDMEKAKPYPLPEVPAKDEKKTKIERKL